MKTILLKNCTRSLHAVVVVCALSLLVCAQSESGADAGSNFTGVVRYENNAPAQFVQVELWTDGEASWRTLTATDRMGKFQAGAPCMVIQYKINAAGYHPIYGRVDMSMKPCRVLEWVTLKVDSKSVADKKEIPAAGVFDSRLAGTRGMVCASRCAAGGAPARRGRRDIGQGKFE